MSTKTTAPQTRVLLTLALLGSGAALVAKKPGSLSYSLDGATPHMVTNDEAFAEVAQTMGKPVRSATADALVDAGLLTHDPETDLYTLTGSGAAHVAHLLPTPPAAAVTGLPVGEPLGVGGKHDARNAKRRERKDRQQAKRARAKAQAAPPVRRGKARKAA